MKDSSLFSTFDLFHGQFQFSSEPAWLRLILAILVFAFFAALLWKLPVWVIAGILVPKSLGRLGTKRKG